MLYAMKATLEFIGCIRTPYRTLEECPRNVDPCGPLCELVIDTKLEEGLSGLAVGQEILVLYWFENVNRHTYVQEARNHGKRLGTFALRSPHRPNPIAVAVVKIENIDGKRVSVRGLDCLDGTPLLDIKPAIMNERSTP